MVETLQRLFRHYQEHGPALSAERLKKLTAERRMAEMEADRIAGLYVPRSEISPILRNLSLNQRAALQNKLEVELPAKLVGLDAISIRLRMIETTNTICDMFNMNTRQWLDGPPVPPQV